MIGPPVELASEVADVLNYVLSQLHGTPLEGFQVSQTAGLPYIDRWMLESDTHQRPNRPGMHGAEVCVNLPLLLWYKILTFSRSQVNIVRLQR